MARAWRFAGRREQPINARDPFVQDMLASGRRPSAVEGAWKSRPGAPMSERDSTPFTIAPPDTAGFTPDASWNSFFTAPKSWEKGAPVARNGVVQPIGEPVKPQAGAGDNFDGIQNPVDRISAAPSPSNPTSYLDATKASQDSFFAAASNPLSQPLPNMQITKSGQTPYGPVSVATPLPNFPQLEDAMPPTFAADFESADINSLTSKL